MEDIRDTFESESECIEYFKENPSLFYSGIIVFIGKARNIAYLNLTDEYIIFNYYKFPKIINDTYTTLKILKNILSIGNNGEDIPASIKFDDVEYRFVKDETGEYICLRKINL